ncbi:hypothetical protein Tco_0731226 [Tanacetum coccineum]
MEYSDQDIADFEERLERIHYKGTHRVQVLDFEGMPELIRDVLYARMWMEHRDGDGAVVFTSQAWGRVFKTKGPLVRELILEFLSILRFGEVLLDLDTPSTIEFQLGGSMRCASGREFILALGLNIGEEIEFLGTSPSYTLIRDLVLRLYYRMMAHNIAGKCQAPEKVTGLTVTTLARPIIDMTKLARVQICVKLGDTWAWVPAGPARQKGNTGGVVEEASVAPCDNRMSTPMFVDPEISTQADGAQSPRVPIPFPEDPYEAIRQAYLVEAETRKSTYTIASPTLLLDSTPLIRHAEYSVDSDTSGARPMSSDFTTPLSPDHPLNHTTPTLVPLLHTTVRMAVYVPPTMSPGLSASIAKVEAMSNSTFRMRFRSSYESSPSFSLADLPLQKHYQGTSKLVEVDEEEEDDEEEDEEIEESLDFDSESEGEEDGGDEGPAIRVESLGLGEDAVVPKGQQRAAPDMEIAVEPERPERVSALRQPTLTTWIDLEDGIAYIDVPTYPPSTPPVQTLLSLEWSSGSLPVSLAPSIVPLPISSPMIPLTIPSHIASPATTKAEGFLTEYDGDIGDLFTRSGAVRDEIFSQRYRFRSLEHEPERVAVTFVAIWRPVLALESWADQTDAQRAALWHAISDTQIENRELRLHIAEERRAWLDLAVIVNSMRREQEPRGDV